MAFDDIIGNTPVPQKIVNINIDVEIMEPWLNETEEVIETIAMETASRHLMIDVFEKVPSFREKLQQSLVDLIGMMPVNSTWEEIVDVVLDKIFWKS